MKYVAIADGSPAPPPPAVIEVAIAKQKPVPHSVAKLVKKDDIEYSDAVEWWMFMQGYVKEGE